MRILAIDPGYDRLGVAIVDREKGQKEVLIYSDCVQTTKTDSTPARIHVIGLSVKKIIKKFKPEALAIEKLYFSNNQKTALAVAEVRGVIMYEASCANIPIHEFTPSDIKIAVTGYGSATKDAVMKMVPKLIEMKKEKCLDDEMDAIALGITALAHMQVKSS